MKKYGELLINRGKRILQRIAFFCMYVIITIIACLTILTAIDQPLASDGHSCGDSINEACFHSLAIHKIQ